MYKLPDRRHASLSALEADLRQCLALVVQAQQTGAVATFADGPPARPGAADARDAMALQAALAAAHDARRAHDAADSSAAAQATRTAAYRRAIAATPLGQRLARAEASSRTEG